MLEWLSAPMTPPPFSCNTFFLGFLWLHLPTCLLEYYSNQNDTNNWKFSFISWKQSIDFYSTNAWNKCLCGTNPIAFFKCFILNLFVEKIHTNQVETKVYSSWNKKKLIKSLLVSCRDCECFWLTRGIHSVFSSSSFILLFFASYLNMISSIFP